MLCYFLPYSKVIQYLIQLYIHVRASLVAQTVKNPPVMQETQVQSLGLKDPLEKGMAIQSSVLAWRIPRTEEPGGIQSMGPQKNSTKTKTYFSGYRFIHTRTISTLLLLLSRFSRVRLCATP